MISKRYFVLAIIIPISLGLGFLYGLWTYHYKKPPYKQMRAIYRDFVQRPSHPEYASIAKDHWHENVERMIAIMDSNDVHTRRRQLIDFVWKGAGFPTWLDPRNMKHSVGKNAHREIPDDIMKAD